MSLLGDWTDDARKSYCAYGADLIRTSCLLLCTTPSVTYRAAVLFQRFQAVVEGVRRGRGDYVKEGRRRSASKAMREGAGGDPLASSHTSPYVLPSQVGKEYTSGIIMLGDLYAPIDFCLFNLRKHDDISYLCAACVLIAAKVEDPSTRIRQIVGVFMRLNMRRRGDPVIELLQPPPEQYDHFKLCVVEAEDIVLQALGFQTFVECPFKYAILFLGMLLEDSGGSVTSLGATSENASVTDAAGSGAAVGRSVTSSGPSPAVDGAFAAASARNWLSNAVCWLNDIPRCIELYSEEAHVLAVCALHATRPPNVVGFPDEWTLAFGVEKAKMNALLSIHRKHLELAVNSEVSNIDLLLTTRGSKPDYKQAGADGAANQGPVSPIAIDVASMPPTTSAPATATATSIASAPQPPPQTPPASSDMSAIDSGVRPPTMKPVEPAASSYPSGIHVQPKLSALQSALQIPITAATPTRSATLQSTAVEPATVLGVTEHTSSMSMESAVSGAVRAASDDEPQFEDLKELQKRRRLEEEKRSKRRRSSSRRKRHRSEERRRRRSSSKGTKRRRTSAKPRRKRSSSRRRQRHQQSGKHSSSHHHHHHHHKRGGSNSQQRRHHHRDDKQHHDTRKRHEGRSDRHRR
ncbi:hypothetical protein ERJ75_000039200 [Trypanosoma vivax]|nr:hypothetical protein ERJ75_000039200 [Trypanosoma vivax]